LAGGCISQPANFAAFFSILLKIIRERVQIPTAKNGPWKNRKGVIEQQIFWQKVNDLRSINGGSRMSERLRNAMEQGERMRHPPARKEKQDDKETKAAAGWSWNAVEWPTIRSNMKMKSDK
jgi:hypothetical protein